MVIQMHNMVENNTLQFNYQLRGFNLRLHLHRFPELVYIIDGRMRLRIGDQRYIAEQGDFLLLHPMQIHGYHTFTACNCVVMAVPPSLFGGLLPSDDTIGETPVFRCCESVEQYFRAAFVAGEIDGIGIRDDGRMPYTIDRHYVDYRDTAVRGRIQSCLMGVMAEYLRTVPLIRCPRNEHVVVKLFTYINDHFLEDISLSTASAALGYSSGYLSNCMQKTSMMSFPTVLASFRIDYAKTLMSSGKMSNLEIALASGFGSERSFQRMFKRLQNCTPMEYRKKNNIV